MSTNFGELLLLDSAPHNTDELQKFFYYSCALARPPEPLDRFEHEHPESFAFRISTASTAPLPIFEVA
jgi:hypothetical protein